MDKLQILRQYFGHSGFRNGQETAVDAILSGQDVLAIMPTGAGKSVCYQLPALMLPGVTLVISPLIALMQDQVESLRQAGIPAACINSSQSSDEFFSVMNDARRGAYKLIYIAPERLLTESFTRFALSVSISMITVDEAHCVSQWGQDFRLSYLDIAGFVERLPRRPVLSAFTATATEQVSRDIISFLGLRSPVRITTGFDRPNLFFSVEKDTNKFESLLNHLKRFKNKSGIIYCHTRKLVDEICRALKKRDIPATKYHAGLTREERMDNQEDFIYDIKPIMVATTAFGMGIDKSNVSFVIHYNMPSDIESYYQEAGRAGRDGEPAECILMYDYRDYAINSYLIKKSIESSKVTDPATVKSLYTKAHERLRSMEYYCTYAECLRSCMLRYFGESPAHHCGHCSECLGKTEKKGITSEAIKIISCIYRGQQKGYHLSRTMTAKVLTGSTQRQLHDMRLDKLSTYGIMSECSYSSVVEMIDTLLAGGNIASRPYKEYSELVINEASASIIRKEKQVSMRIAKKEELPEYENVTPEEEALFQKLRKVRQDIALREHVPPYVVFSNAALRDMCRKKPRNRSEFMEVAGVGAMRAEKYGEKFVSAIVSFLKS